MTATSPYTHCTVVAEGCHGRPRAPIVSRHRSLDAAIKRAKRNDRLAVYAYDSAFSRAPEGACLYQLAPQNHPVLGVGRYGLGARK